MEIRTRFEQAETHVFRIHDAGARPQPPDITFVMDLQEVGDSGHNTVFNSSERRQILAARDRAQPPPSNQDQGYQKHYQTARENMLKYFNELEDLVNKLG